MPLSSDRRARSRQLANLKRGATVSPGRPPVHGANSRSLVRPLRERYLAELSETFPGASSQELAIQAHRLAQLELLGDFVDRRGVIRHQRRGDVFPAAQFMERVASAFERQHALLVQREAESGKYDALASYLNDDNEDDDDGETGDG